MSKDFKNGIAIGVICAVVAYLMLTLAYSAGRTIGKHLLPAACEAMPVDTITHRGTR